MLSKMTFLDSYLYRDGHELHNYCYSYVKYTPQVTDCSNNKMIKSKIIPHRASQEKINYQN